MTLDMSNLGPGRTGVDAYIHVFQDVDRRARHGPRIKVFPGSPGEGNATVIVVPRSPDQRAQVKGRNTVDRRTLRRALRFAELNREPLARFWSDPTMTIDALLDEIVPVEE